MNILITRPLIDAEDMMQKLFSSGHKIFHLPTLKITSNNASSINSDDYDAFIFTSANAIRHLSLKNNNKKIQCFCVGTMTEKIARQNGFTNTISAGGTVNALKNLILISDKVNKKSKLAYFCGDHISYDLEGELKKEGFQIDKIINYQSTKIS
jgi:uroporphyrinogen-III synthase